MSHPNAADTIIVFILVFVLFNLDDDVARWIGELVAEAAKAYEAAR